MSIKLKDKYLLATFIGFLSFLLLLQVPLFRDFRDMLWDKLVAKTAAVLRVGNLKVENDVEEQVRFLLVENIRLRAENNDYKRLQRQLGSAAWDDFRKVPATILSSPADIFRSQFILNKGANDGIVLGAPVVINGSILVGTVEELNNNTSLLRLLYHPETSIKAEVILKEGVSRGLVLGKTFTGIEMIEIPRDAKLAEGQEVVALGQPGLIPYGLMIGKIELIKSGDRDPYQRARLSTWYDAGEIVAVNILTPK